MLINTTKNYQAIIDDDMSEEISRHKWTYNGNGYAYRHLINDGKFIKIYMHRQIIRAKKGQMVDHINGNRLDNRLENLRIATSKQNSGNSGSRKGSVSKFKGVIRARKKWSAQIAINRKSTYLGMFEREEDAALAYNFAALEYFGDFAYLNRAEHV